MTTGTERFDTWWPRITRAASFIVGLGILAYSAFGNLPDRPWLYGAAITLMVPPAAGQIEKILRGAGAGGTGDPIGPDDKGVAKGARKL